MIAVDVAGEAVRCPDTAREVLLEAKQMVLDGRWAQGQFVWYVGNDPRVESYCVNPDPGSLTGLTARLKGWGEVPVDPKDCKFCIDGLLGFRGGWISGYWSDNRPSNDAWELVCKALGLPSTHGSGLWEWNDDPERTEADVIAALDGALALCDAEAV